MNVTIASLENIKKRGISEKTDGGWICHACRSEIQVITTGRSIWWEGFLGGPGEVRQVGEVYCPKCDKKPSTSYGAPIYEKEFMTQ